MTCEHTIIIQGRHPSPLTFPLPLPPHTPLFSVMPALRRISHEKPSLLPPRLLQPATRQPPPPTKLAQPNATARTEIKCLPTSFTRALQSPLKGANSNFSGLVFFDRGVKVRSPTIHFETSDPRI